MSVYTLILTTPYCPQTPASSQESFAISRVEIRKINEKPCAISSLYTLVSTPPFLSGNESDVKIKEMTLTSEVRRKCDCVTIHSRGFVTLFTDPAHRRLLTMDFWNVEVNI